LSANRLIGILARKQANRGGNNTMKFSVAFVSGAQLLGPLPNQIASSIPIAAGVLVGTRSPDAASAFIEFTKGRTAAAILKAKGFDPG
jgi:ABC-type molybdate transport system substrate-binding protein